MVRLGRLLAATALALATACSTPPPAAVGTLERARVELVAEDSEPIVEILVREGQDVAAGDVLLRLDSRRAQARLAHARGERDRAAARLAELVRGTRQELIDQARAQVREEEARETDARADVERTSALVRSRVAPPADLDDARAVLGEVVARRDARVADLERLLHGATREELDQAEADLAAAEGALAESSVSAERHAVKAPVGGRLDVLPYELGEQPPVGGVVAVMLAGGAPHARVYVPASRRAGVTPGSPATVTIDGVPGSFRGRVRAVSADASFTPYFALTERDRGRLSYLAEVDLTDERARDLPTGLPLEAVFESAAPGGAPAAPAAVPPGGPER